MWDKCVCVCVRVGVPILLCVYRVSKLQDKRNHFFLCPLFPPEGESAKGADITGHRKAHNILPASATAV